MEKRLGDYIEKRGGGEENSFRINYGLGTWNIEDNVIT